MEQREASYEETEISKISDEDNFANLPPMEVLASSPRKTLAENSQEQNS
jgi:hypothetical protein